MKFLEAHAAAKAFRGGPELELLLGCSAVTSTLEVFIRGHAARNGYAVVLETLPFGTLGQHLRINTQTERREVFILFPWSLLPQADWRLGLPARSPEDAALLDTIDEHVALFLRRRNAAFIYIAAPVPPLARTAESCRILEYRLFSAAQTIGASVFPAGSFHLSSYLQSGNAFASGALSEIAAAVVQAGCRRARSPKKVLVTDFDNTLWGGIVGEDGPDNLAHAAHGDGYPFFLYQSLLKKLRNEGVLLVGVSRNDPDLARAPLHRGDMVLRDDDFVAVIASYHSKSAQIEHVAQNLNLGLDSIVFVDDNTIELEEVKRSLPAVECVRFSPDAALPEVLECLVQHFGTAVLTEEDAKRTELYRLRASSIVPVEDRGADVRTFLQSLEMCLTIRQRRYGAHTRCLQLINKTNQFNLNGRRFTETELAQCLEAGGCLIGATLDERNGSHGEIAAVLIDASGTIEAFVMSCRVFQRRVEHALAAWLASRAEPPRALRYAATERNAPFAMFLKQIGADRTDGLVAFDATKLAAELAPDLELVKIVEESA